MRRVTMVRSPLLAADFQAAAFNAWPMFFGPDFFVDAVKAKRTSWYGAIEVLAWPKSRSQYPR